MQAPFSIIRNALVVHLVDNFDSSDMDELETRLLDTLCRDKHLRGVIFNFSEVSTTDPHDLRRLESILMAVKLVGSRIGLCGINPGLAAVIVHAGINLQRETIGSDLDDIFLHF